MMDDNALMTKVQQGEIDRLAILFERHHVSLFHYFIRTGNNRAASEDLVQETFVKVLAYRSSFSGNALFKSWLFGIARNTKADYYRKNKRLNEHENIDQADIKNDHNLSQEHEASWQTNMFEKALTSLEPEQREIVILSRYHNLNYEEIASMQNCNINTLKSRMRKSLVDLKYAFDRLTRDKL